MSTYTINSDKAVAVAVDTYWLPASTCPQGVKVQLLSKGGVAVYGINNGDSFWTHWCPLPKKPNPPAGGYL